MRILEKSYQLEACDAVQAISGSLLDHDRSFFWLEQPGDRFTPEFPLEADFGIVEMEGQAIAPGELFAERAQIHAHKRFPAGPVQFIADTGQVGYAFGNCGAMVEEVGAVGIDQGKTQGIVFRLPYQDIAAG